MADTADDHAFAARAKRLAQDIVAMDDTDPRAAETAATLRDRIMQFGADIAFFLLAKDGSLSPLKAMLDRDLNDLPARGHTQPSLAERMAAIMRGRL